MNSERHFRIIQLNNKNIKLGNVHIKSDSTPINAVKKLLMNLTKNNKLKLQKATILIQESTKGSTKKIYGPYLGNFKKNKLIEVKKKVKVNESKFKKIMKGGSGRKLKFEKKIIQESKVEISSENLSREIKEREQKNYGMLHNFIYPAAVLKSAALGAYKGVTTYGSYFKTLKNISNKNTILVSNKDKINNLKEYLKSLQNKKKIYDSKIELSKPGFFSGLLITAIKYFNTRALLKNSVSEYSQFFNFAKYTLHPLIKENYENLLAAIKDSENIYVGIKIGVQIGTGSGKKQVIFILKSNAFNFIAKEGNDIVNDVDSSVFLDYLINNLTIQIKNDLFNFLGIKKKEHSYIPCGTYSSYMVNVYDIQYDKTNESNSKRICINKFDGGFIDFLENISTNENGKIYNGKIYIKKFEEQAINNSAEKTKNRKLLNWEKFTPRKSSKEKIQENILLEELYKYKKEINEEEKYAIFEKIIEKIYSITDFDLLRAYYDDIETIIDSIKTQIVNDKALLNRYKDCEELKKQNNSTLNENKKNLKNECLLIDEYLGIIQKSSYEGNNQKILNNFRKSKAYKYPRIKDKYQKIKSKDNNKYENVLTKIKNKFEKTTQEKQEHFKSSLIPYQSYLKTLKIKATYIYENTNTSKNANTSEIKDKLLSTSYVGKSKTIKVYKLSVNKEPFYVGDTSSESDLSYTLYMLNINSDFLNTEFGSVFKPNTEIQKKRFYSTTRTELITEIQKKMLESKKNSNTPKFDLNLLRAIQKNSITLDAMTYSSVNYEGPFIYMGRIKEEKNSQNDHYNDVYMKGDGYFVLDNRIFGRGTIFQWTNVYIDKIPQLLDESKPELGYKFYKEEGTNRVYKPPEFANALKTNWGYYGGNKNKNKNKK